MRLSESFAGHGVHAEKVNAPFSARGLDFAIIQISVGFVSTVVVGSFLFCFSTPWVHLAAALHSSFTLLLNALHRAHLVRQT